MLMLMEMMLHSVPMINNINGYDLAIREMSKFVGPFKVGPSISKLAIIGALIGGCLTAFFIVAKYLFENKVRDHELSRTHLITRFFMNQRKKKLILKSYMQI